MRAENQNRRKRTKKLPPALFAGTASQQHLFGLVDLGREIGRAPLVGMQLLHQRAVGALDLGGVRPRRHAKDLVSLLLGHLAATPRRLTGVIPRRRTTLRV